MYSARARSGNADALVPDDPAGVAMLTTEATAVGIRSEQSKTIPLSIRQVALA
jgi:hypothetical protein